MIQIQQLKNHLLVPLIVFATFFVIKPVFATEFFATVANPNLEVGEFVQVDFYLDTENTEINALETTITYPSEILEVVDYTYGNSVINYWIEKPHLQNNGSELFFSGITPGGFNEESAYLMSLIFKAVDTGRAEIYFKNTKTLENNGLGTEVKSTAKKIFINIQPALTGEDVENIYKIIDEIPPESFEPLIIEDSAISLGKKALVFNTLDKESGLASYEVLEEKIINIFGWEFKIGRWTPAQSPYLLKDQKLKSNIYVKAIDRAGNFYVASVLLAKSSHWYTDFNFWVIIIIAILLLYLFWRVYVHYRKKNKSR